MSLDGNEKFGWLIKKKRKKKNIVNATIGSLYDEDGNLVALDTVF